MLRANWIVLLWLASVFFTSIDDVAAQDPIESAVGASVRIHKGAASGTGFFVVLDETPETPKRHVLVTAAHVFNEMSGPSCTVVLRSKKPNGETQRNETTLVIRDGEKPLWVRHSELDVAAIVMPLPEDADITPFAFRQIADASWMESRKVRVGESVCIPCFPAKVEANSTGWPVLRKGSIATHPLVPVANVKTLYVDYSHFGGDSGSAVVAVKENEPLVVGIVFAMLRQTDKAQTTFEERTLHTSLGMALAVPSHFVRQTIELLPKK